MIHCILTCWSCWSTGWSDLSAKQIDNDNDKFPPGLGIPSSGVLEFQDLFQQWFVDKALFFWGWDYQPKTDLTLSAAAFSDLTRLQDQIFRSKHAAAALLHHRHTALQKHVVPQWVGSFDFIFSITRSACRVTANISFVITVCFKFWFCPMWILGCACFNSGL